MVPPDHGFSSFVFPSICLSLYNLKYSAPSVVIIWTGSLDMSYFGHKCFYSKTSSQMKNNIVKIIASSLLSEWKSHSGDKFSKRKS